MPRYSLNPACAWPTLPSRPLLFPTPACKGQRRERPLRGIFGEREPTRDLLVKEDCGSDLLATPVWMVRDS